MGMTNKVLKILAADDVELRKLVDKLSEAEAKELVYTIVSKMNKDRLENLSEDLRG